MNLNGKEYFYIRNVQNDVIGLHDSEGKVVVNYSYDTWGNIVSISGSLKDSVGKKNPYRYRGYRYDEETGLYYLQSRYYNAEWGRFINADAGIAEVGNIQGYNMFQYCFNNPINMDDESGHWPKWSKIKSTVKKVVSKVKSTVKKYGKSVGEFIGGISMVIGGVAAIATGNVVVGVAAIVYGANHIYSGIKDTYYTYKGNKSKVGKNNLIKSGMQTVAGKKAGNTIYNASEFVVAVATLKIPTPQKLAKVNPTTIVNMKFGMVQESITSYSGIHGVKNIFSSGISRYNNIDMLEVGKFINSVKGRVDKFIKIF